MTRWFPQCYRVEVDAMSGHAEWKRSSFPKKGNVGEQDSRLHHALEECARISNQILIENRKRDDKERKRKAREEAEKKANGG